MRMTLVVTGLRPASDCPTSKLELFGAIQSSLAMEHFEHHLEFFFPEAKTANESWRELGKLVDCVRESYLRSGFYDVVVTR